ncbi:MAG: hypothetical protein II889_08255 [Clostridia bacterium]|nr:hypothetical protein [Clostridia bacterium]MCR4907040.1 hypothetical protein [Clostridiales bacterium]
MGERIVFPSLCGNDRLRRLFASDAEGGKTAHAYILEGPPGSGRHTAARLIAAATLCEHRADPDRPLPCGTCLSCRKILGGSSVDVLTVSRGDRATLGVGEIRSVKETLYVTPNDGERKFYFIEDAHLMTVQAQNALLLSLEEPPPYVLFFLLCEDASLLLETIRSRAPVLRMERFQPAFIEEWLEKKIPGADRERLVTAAHLANGALGTAEALYRDGGDALENYRMAAELVRLLFAGRRSETAAYLLSLPLQPKDRMRLRQILTLARFAVRDILAEKRGGTLLFFSERDGIPPYAKRISLRRCADLMAKLAHAEEDIAANVTPSLVMTALAANA